jgi:drug/metabolite transporter (DMT)-like permease
MDNNTPIRPWIGMALVASSAVAYSTAGYFTRLIDLDVPTMLFWRGLYAGLFMTLFIIAVNGPDTLAIVRKIGWPGIQIAILSALATVCYLNALRLTTVAEVMAINATSPFLSGALAWLIIGERENWKVVVASFVALIGVIVMVGASMQSGNVAGAILAFAMTLSLVSMIVIIRAYKAISMLPASCLSAFLSALVMLPLTSPVVPTGNTMLNLALFGVIQFGLGLILLTIGSRYVSAIRSSLLSRLQTVLGPIWVWLAFNEVPPGSTLIGGSLIVVAAIASIFLATKPQR